MSDTIETTTEFEVSRQVKTKQDLLGVMVAKHACYGPQSATEWVGQQPNTATAQDIWNTCERPDWMLWLAGRCGVPQRTLVQLACVFARSMVQFVPAGELRPLAAIETTEAWVRSEATIEQVNAAKRAAWQARYDLRNTAAYAAADAADAADAAYAAADAAYAAADAAAAAYAAYARAAAADARRTTYKEIRREFCNVIRKAIPEVPL